jgi:hypothetical protein
MAAYHRPAHDLDEEVTADIAPDLLRDVILPSALLSSDECSDDFRSMYALRVEEEIELAHGDLRRVLGEGRFAALVRNFLGSESSPCDLARAPLGFAVFLRSEAARDPAVWTARQVVLHRPGAVIRRRAS